LAGGALPLSVIPWIFGPKTQKFKEITQ